MPKKSKFPRLRTHVRKSKSGKVRAYYFYDMRPDGKPDIALGTEYDEALEKWRELYEHKPRVKGRIQEAIDRWVEQELPGYPIKKTRQDYARQIENVGAVFGMMAWHEVTLPMLREYLDRRKAKTQGNREMAVLSIVWHKALLWGMTGAQWPAQGVKGWKHPEKARVFQVTDQLFNAVYAEADQMLKDCMDIATATGYRLTDCRTVRLPADDVLRCRASKTGKASDFDLQLSSVLPGLIERRRAIHAAHVMLLSTPDGFPVTEPMLRRAWDKARELAAERHPALADDIRAMWLRDMRKRASDLVGSDEAASTLLDHSSVGLTRKHYRTVSTLKIPAR